MLLVDEALAVGDQRFKNKSRKAMEKALSNTGTMFLVSHSTRQIKANCDRVLWIEDGRLIADGPVDDVTAAYEEAMDE